MNILITGGAGFIGSHIGDALIAAGHRVIVVDNLSTGRKENIPPQAVFYEADIRDREYMENIFSQEHIEAVYHEAAQTMVPYSLAHPWEDAELNVMGLVGILELCRRHTVRKFIFSSSAAVYGDNTRVPLKETEATTPLSFYGLTKCTAEAYIRMYHDIFQVPYVILRYANVYGERQGGNGEGGVVFVFSQALAQGKEITVFGDGEQTRDFVYVKDVARANVCALQAKGTEGTYNIATNIETTVNALKEMLVYIAGTPTHVHYEPVRSGDIYRSVLANTKAVQELGWEPTTKLLGGLQQTYRYFAGEVGK